MFQPSFACNPTFFLTWEKSYEDIYHSPSHVSVITGNILIATPRFTRHYFSWHFFATIFGEVWMNTTLFNFHYIRDMSKWRKFFPIPVPEYAFHIRVERLKLTYYSSISNFSRSWHTLLLILTSHDFPL